MTITNIATFDHGTSEMGGCVSLFFFFYFCLLFGGALLRFDLKWRIETCYIVLCYLIIYVYLFFKYNII